MILDRPIREDGTAASAGSAGPLGIKGSPGERVGVFYSESFTIRSRGRDTIEITDQVARISRASGVARGLASVFVHHTSASLIICENADPSVRTDLERFFGRLVPDGDPLFLHTAEGPDDMPAHVRSILTQASVAIPVAAGRPDLGTWQGVFLFEHRTHPHSRKVTVSIVGEPASTPGRSAASP